MQEEIRQLKREIEQLKSAFIELSLKVETLSDATYKAGKREYINHEIQFMQKCYNKNGTLISQINT